MDLNGLQLRSITRSAPAGPRLVESDAPLAASDTEDTSEAGLMARLASGDADALAQLLNLYWQPLQEYAAGLLGSSDAAEDVVQEAFVGLWDHRTGWHPGSVRAYLFRSTRNLALNERRRTRVRRRWLDLLRQRPQHEQLRAPDAAEAQELQAAARRALEKLPPRRREVFMLARFHGLSYRQIAEIMGTSQQTVANQMSSALAELRVILAAFL